MEPHERTRSLDGGRPPASAAPPSTTRRSFVGGVAGVAGLAGAAGAAAGQEGGDTVEVVVGPDGSLVFEPADLEIPPGTTVRFTWDSDLHNVVVDGQPDEADWSGTQGGEGETYDTGHEYSHTFDVEGVYEYYCSPHRTSGMEGTITVASSATVPAADAGAGAGPAGRDGGSTLLVTVAGIGLTALTVGAVYFYGWRPRPDTEPEADAGDGEGAVRVRDREDAPELGTRHGGPMYEADVADHETGSVDHDAFDPVGTGALLVGYFLLVGLLWLFMYFVEFLGNGPKVVG